MKDSCENAQIIIHGNKNIKKCDNVSSFYFDGKSELEIKKTYLNTKSISFCIKPTEITGESYNMIFKFAKDGAKTYFCIKRNIIYVNNKEITIPDFKFEVDKIYHIVILENKLYINNKKMLEYNRIKFEEIKGNLIIGGYNGKYFYKGYLNNFKIYDYDLSETEIEELYLYSNLEKDCISFLPLEDTLFDISGGYDGNMETGEEEYENYSFKFNGERIIKIGQIFKEYISKEIPKFTISYWVKIKDTSKNQVIISDYDSKDSGTSKDYIYLLHNVIENNELKIKFQSQEKQKEYKFEDFNEEWTFISLNYFINEKIEIYKNGEKVGEIDISDLDFKDYSGNLRIGGNLDIEEEDYFVGNFKGLKFFNRNLSDKELQYTFYNTAPKEI